MHAGYENSESGVVSRSRPIGQVWPLSSETDSRSGVRAPQLVPVGLWHITSLPEPASLHTSIPLLLFGMVVRTAGLQVLPPSTLSDR